ncbi:HPP family protein [Deltaproteobacteria bacterium Smac51]|nr:HPP family protein [Deltaproteobacteria bacterium Smac51]
MTSDFFQKMKGVSKAPPAPRGSEILLAFAGSCTAMVIIGLFHNFFFRSTGGLPLIMAPLGASAVLVFGAMRSPLAQPRNVIGGHVISALIGVTVYQIVGDSQLLAFSLAVPSAIAAMHRTGTLHPPGGATAFVTAAGGASVHQWGYWYVLSPCLLGGGIMILIALVVNNLPKEQRYPQFW